MDPIKAYTNYQEPPSYIPNLTRYCTYSFIGPQVLHSDT